MNLNEPVEEKKMITNQILLNTIEGLKGKTIAYSSGTAPYLWKKNINSSW